MSKAEYKLNAGGASYTMSLCVVGAKHSGKSTLIHKLMHPNDDVSRHKQVSTVSSQFLTCKFRATVDARTCVAASDTYTNSAQNNAVVTLDFYDTAGQNAMHVQVNSILRGKDVVMCCFDLTDMYSLLMIAAQSSRYMSANDTGSYFLVGCKADASARACAAWFGAQEADSELDRLLWTVGTDDALRALLQDKDLVHDMSVLHVPTEGGELSEEFSIKDVVGHAAGLQKRTVDIAGAPHHLFAPALFCPLVQTLCTFKGTAPKLKAAIADARAAYWKSVVGTADTAPTQDICTQEMMFYRHIPVLPGMVASFIDFSKRAPQALAHMDIKMCIETSAYTNTNIQELFKQYILFEKPLRKQEKLAHVNEKPRVVLGDPARDTEEDKSCAC